MAYLTPMDQRPITAVRRRGQLLVKNTFPDRYNKAIGGMDPILWFEPSMDGCHFVERAPQTPANNGDLLGFACNKAAEAANPPEQVINGSLTKWTGNIPDGWSVADGQTPTEFVEPASPGCRIYSKNGAYIGIFQAIPNVVEATVWEIEFQLIITKGAIKVGSGYGASDFGIYTQSGRYKFYLTSSSGWIASPLTLHIGRETVAGLEVDAIVRDVSIKQSVPPEQVRDGTFDFWTDPATPLHWTVPAQTATEYVEKVPGGIRCYSAAGGLIGFTQTGFPEEKGRTLTFDLTIVSGAFKVGTGYGGSDLGIYTQSGTYNVPLPEVLAGINFFRDPGFGVPIDVTINNVSIQSAGSALIAPADDQRPIYNTDPGPARYTFDGVNDEMVAQFPGGAGPADCSVFQAIRTTDDLTFILFYNETNEYCWTAHKGDPGTIFYSGIGSPEFWIDGVEVPAGTTRGGLYDLLADGQWHICEARKCAMSAWDNFKLGNRSSWSYDGDYGPQIVIPTDNFTDAQRDEIIIPYLKQQVGL